MFILYIVIKSCENLKIINIVSAGKEPGDISASKSSDKVASSRQDVYAGKIQRTFIVARIMY